MEIWKDIKGYEGLYQVSDLGRVKSLKFKKQRILKPVLVGNGYYAVNLHKGGSQKSKTIHQLVAVTFLNHEPCGHEIVVDHIDNDKTNNKVENLQLITVRHNVSKDWKGKTSKYTGVSWNKRQRVWKAVIRVNGKLKFLGHFDCELKAAKAYNNYLKQEL